MKSRLIQMSPKKRADSIDINNAYIILVVFEFNGISDDNSNEELSLLYVRLSSSGLVVVPLTGRPTINTIYYSILISIYGIIIIFKV